jgi:hypothetical protein
MRRGASTVVVVVGEVASSDLGLQLREAPNVAVVEGPAQGFEAATEALSAASRHAAPYVVVTADPLSELAAQWHGMWDVGVAPGTAPFEEEAARVLAAWRSGRFELPDYYLVVAPERDVEAAPHPNDFHLGVLASQRATRVVPVPVQPVHEGHAALRSSLANLPSGPWWPPLDRLVEAARSFFPQQVSGAPSVRIASVGSPNRSTAEADERKYPA